MIDDVEVVFSAVGTPDEDGRPICNMYWMWLHLWSRLEVYNLGDKVDRPCRYGDEGEGGYSRGVDRRGEQIPFDEPQTRVLEGGAAIWDFMSPDRVVVGVESEQAKDVMSRLYRPFLLNNFRVIFTDIPSAEMIKYAANSMLASRISFMNDIANLCELVGADVIVRKGIGSDSRIGGKFLYPGCGYGGSCFPKDVKALVKSAEQAGYTMRVLQRLRR